jgi:peroxiredoxin Q/BCP
VVHAHYLIGTDGKVVRRWDKVKVDGHADEVIEALG